MESVYLLMVSVYDDEKMTENKFDYSVSTMDNFADSKARFVGKYGNLRSHLDYSYHKLISEERQILHDSIIDQFQSTIIYDGEYMCEKPTVNWIVFTAGPMGSGKTYTLSWLSENKYFPLEAFVRVDPDILRDMLPETSEYFRRNPNTAGALTQREVGYISEVMTLDALMNGKNVIVDGSLRHVDWYASYIDSLRKRFPILKIAIMEVSAPAKTTLSRALKRAEISGRVVPVHVLEESIRQVPLAVAQLKPLADYTCTLRNDDCVTAADASGESEVKCSEPELVRTSSGSLSWPDFRSVWKMSCAFSSRKHRSTSSLLSVESDDVQRTSDDRQVLQISQVQSSSNAEAADVPQLDTSYFYGSVVSEERPSKRFCYPGDASSVWNEEKLKDKAYTIENLHSLSRDESRGTSSVSRQSEIEVGLGLTFT